MMKLRILTPFLLLLFLGFSQDTDRPIPSANIQTLQGRPFDSKNFSNDGKPMIINFWATWCKPCRRELNAIDDEYEEWQEETGVKLIAVSIDDARSRDRVRPFVHGQGWDYEIYLDPNQNLMRALNVNNPPHTFLVNGEGRIGWQHNGYAPGDEKKLFKKVKGLLAEEGTD
jgi:thiol-disulfide isomerase/thioredoxin